MRADGRGLADDDARRVVDEEVLADCGAGVDVHARLAVRVFGHEAGNERDLTVVEDMGDAVDEDGKEAGVGEDDLLLALGCRVAVEGRLHIFEEQLLDMGELGHEGIDNGVGVRLDVLRGERGSVAEQERLVHLRAQGVADAHDLLSHVVLRTYALECLACVVAGENEAAHVLDDGDDGIAIGEVPEGFGDEDLFSLIVAGNLGHKLIKLRVNHGSPSRAGYVWRKAYQRSREYEPMKAAYFY